MVIVKIELHGAVSGQVKPLGVAHISNTGGKASETVGNYRVELFQWGDQKRIWKRGFIEGFPRKRLGGWDLLYRCLREVVGDRNDARDVPEQGAAYWKARAFAAEDKLDSLRQVIKASMKTGETEELAAKIKELAGP